MSFLCEPARIITADRHPHIELVVEALDASPEVHTPQLVFAGDITQRLEGNRDFDSPPVAGDDALGLKHVVRIEVFVIVGPGAVGLNPERINVEFVCLAFVVESIEENTDIVVVPNIVAL